MDCLTLWLSNLLLQRDAKYAREQMLANWLEILPGLDFHVLLVTNEVGWGIVPDNALARAISRPRRLGQSADRRGGRRSRSDCGGNPDDREEGGAMSLEETLKQIRPLDRSSESAAQRRLDSLTKPQGSLGQLEELARRIAVIQGRVPPRLGRKLLFVFAADHGITAGRRQRIPERRHGADDLQLS